jgi:hypothetical protein
MPRITEGLLEDSVPQELLHAEAGIGHRDHDLGAVSKRLYC